MNNNIISIHGSHNGGIALYIDDKIFVIEYERLLNSKNIGINQYKISSHCKESLEIAMNYIKENYNIDSFDMKLYSNTDIIENDNNIELSNIINAKESLQISHHFAHASGVFYQSDFKDALVISFDGGGDDGYFNIYIADRINGVKLLESIDVDLGFPYMIFAHYIDEISKEWLSDGNLVYSGKLMGLSSYGVVVEEWIEYIKKFYYSKPNGNNYKYLLNVLGEEIGITFDEDNRISEQLAYNLAATSQKVFEEIFIELSGPYIKSHLNLPICLTGGCALNIILNSKLKDEIGNRIFIGPNSNDCGIAVGMLLSYLKPQHPIEVMYSGIPILDKNMLNFYIQKYGFAEIKINPDIDIISSLILNGNIIGVMRGNSEHGPRALGNRSIFCNPSLDNMKDILNKKVKHREWFRPFAAVVLLEDCNTYFDFYGKSPYMSFCAKVREEWKDKLQSVTHIDGTCRIQTVTKDSNEWLYNLLKSSKEKIGHSVLLNTSFNVNGKPISSTIHDAIELLLTSDMNYLLIDNVLIGK